MRGAIHHGHGVIGNDETLDDAIVVVGAGERATLRSGTTTASYRTDPDCRRVARDVVDMVNSSSRR